MRGSRRLPGLLLAGGAVLLNSGCPSLSGIGVAGDGSSDTVVSPTHDASTDVAPDMGLDADGDAESGPACTIDFPPLEAGITEASCSSNDGGTCSPARIGSFMPNWVPPRVARGACTSAQLASFDADCTSGSSAECAPWTSDLNNAGCLACLASTYGASKYGIIIDDGAVSAFNLPGCMVLRDPCSEPCARATQAVDDCERAACAAPCAGSYTGYAACAVLANTCPCSDYDFAFTQCSAALIAAKSPAADCLGQTYAEAINRFAPLFCGP